MVALRRFMNVAVPMTVVLAVVCAGWAQDASSDQAKALFEKGVAQFKAYQYKAAKEILVQVDEGKLSADQKKVRTDLLNRVDEAIRQQSAANEAFQGAEKALAKNDLAKAKEGYAAAANCEFLQPQMRDTAKAQLALVDDRIKLASASTTPPATTAKPVATTPVPKAEPVKPGPVVSKPPVKPAPKPRPERVVAPEPPTLTRAQKQAQLARSEANLEFQKRMMEANDRIQNAAGEKDFDAAKAACEQAREVVEETKVFYSNEQYRVKMAQVDLKREEIEKARAAWQRETVIQQQTEINIAKDRAHRQTIERRKMDVDRLTREVQVLVRQKQYDKAVETMRQILVLDPENVFVKMTIDSYKQEALLRDRKKSNDAFRENEQKQRNLIAEAEIPWWHMLTFPEDWRELTIRRQQYAVTAGGTSESDRQVQAKLRQHIPKLDFEDTEFSAVITFLRETSGVNINPNWTALSNAGVGQDAKISVHLVDVTFERALRVILNNVSTPAAPVNYVVDDGIVTISTKEDLDTRTISRVYDINDLIIRVPNFQGPVLDLSGSNPAANGGSSGGGGGGGGIFGGGGGGTTGTCSPTDNIPTKAQMLEDIKNTIVNAVDPESWKPNGQVGSVSAYMTSLVVLQTAQNHAKVAEVLAQLRESRAIQVSIEARFIQVNSGFLESIGLDLDFYFNLGSNLGSTTVVDPWTGATVPTTNGQSGWNVNKSPSGTNKVTPLGVSQGHSTFTNMIGLGTGIGAGVSNPSMQVGGTFLDDIQVNFLLQATQANETTRTLTAPHITLFNGQRAYVTVGTEQAYLSQFVPIVSDNTQSVQPIVSWVPTGSVLDVEATVTADRRFVTMTIRPQISTLNEMLDFDVGTYTLQLPNVTVQKLETTVNVPDGGTLLLGGQKMATQVEREQGVPLLSKIPIINRAFNNRGMVRDEQTLLILVKPTILIMQEEEAKKFP